MSPARSQQRIVSPGRQREISDIKTTKSQQRKHEYEQP